MRITKRKALFWPGLCFKACVEAGDQHQCWWAQHGLLEHSRHNGKSTETQEQYDWHLFRVQFPSLPRREHSRVCGEGWDLQAPLPKCLPALTVQTWHGIGPAHLQCSLVTTSTQMGSFLPLRITGPIRENKPGSSGTGSLFLAKEKETGDEAHKSASGPAKMQNGVSAAE